MRSPEAYPGCETSNMDARVAWISVAPVKGLALAQREEVLLQPSGVREDRRFHVLGEDGRRLNGKQLGELFRVAADWDGDAGPLQLGFPAGGGAETGVAHYQPG